MHLQGLLIVCWFHCALSFEDFTQSLDETSEDAINTLWGTQGEEPNESAPGTVWRDTETLYDLQREGDPESFLKNTESSHQLRQERDNFGIVEPFPANIFPIEFTPANVTCVAYDTSGIKTPEKILFVRRNEFNEYRVLTANENLFFTNRTEENGRKLFVTLNFRRVTMQDDSNDGRYECHAFAVGDLVSSARHGFSVHVLRVPPTSAPSISPTTPTECGGSFNRSFGIFSSPGFRFPGRYPNNLNCSWTFRIPYHGYLRIWFTVFETERWDFVDLEDNFGGLIERIHGLRSGYSVIVTGRRTTFLRVRFITDSSGSMQGFLAQYNIRLAVPPTSTPTTASPTGCGGRLNSSSGSFSSPGFPRSYTNNLNCLWTMSIPDHGYMRLQFIAFETESCCDFVVLTYIPGERIERISGSRSGYSVIIPGQRTSLLRVRFTTDGSLTRQGFLAQYNTTFAPPFSMSSAVRPTPTVSSTSVPSITPTPPPGCGGSFNDSFGSFSSPGFPRRYPNNLNCLWTLSIPANANLRLLFIIFDTEEDYDFVELTDISGVRIERISGSRSGYTVIVPHSRTPMLRVRFITDSTGTSQGFLARYIITFPATLFPMSSAAPPFSVSSAVRPTPTVTPTSAPSITPTPPTGCGGSFTNFSGSFSSPGYPRNYNNNLNCLWTLSIPAHGSLRLQFIVFETERSWDFVELKDDSGVTIARITGSESGHSVTVAGRRTSLLWVRFKTDRSVTRRGFLARYSITFPPTFPISSAVGPTSTVTPTSASSITPTTPPGCGGSFTNFSGSFWSPGFPMYYTNNLNCLWTLSIPAHGLLLIMFSVFETERGHDFVELTDISGVRIERISGSLSGISLGVTGSRTPLLMVRFTTDSSGTRPGFLARYSIRLAPSTVRPTPTVTPTSASKITPSPPSGCGGWFTNFTGSFSSPGYPRSYINNLNCLWNLNIPARGYMKLEFVVFETEPGFDFVEMTDIFGLRVAKISGSRSGYSVTVAGSRTTVLRVRFTTDRSVTRKGFLARYSVRTTPFPVPSTAPPFPVSSAIRPTPTVTSTSVPSITPTTPTGCGGWLNSSSGSFSSPGFPRSYTNNLNCLWTFIIPVQGYLRLRFLVFETERCCDYVQLTDISSGVTIGMIRGSRSGYSVIIAGRRTPLLRVRFSTDGSVTMRGFHAVYSITFVTPVPTSTVPTTTASSIAPTTPADNECNCYQILQEADRSHAYDYRQVPGGRAKCDDSLHTTWYRFVGLAGDRMPEQCVPPYRCSTNAAGWLRGGHPSVYDFAVRRTVCYHWGNNCCRWSNSILVRNCSGFYVYRLQRPPGCHFRYCGVGLSLPTPTPTQAPTTTTNHGNECFRYRTLREADRSQSYDYRQVSGARPICDDSLQLGWYRFLGLAGDRMPDYCVPSYRCGALAPGWLGGGHPNYLDGVVSRTVCYHWGNSCCRWRNNILVRNCGYFYVYRLERPLTCGLRYCGVGTALSTPTTEPTVRPTPTAPNHGIMILCLPSSMMVNISRKSLSMDPSLLHLSDPECGAVHVDRKYVVMETPLDGCGTVERSIGRNVLQFYNKVVVPSDYGKKRSYLEFPFMCTYNKFGIPGKWGRLTPLHNRGHVVDYTMDGRAT